jgi:hypothetical protein
MRKGSGQWAIYFCNEVQMPVHFFEIQHVQNVNKIAIGRIGRRLGPTHYPSACLDLLLPPQSHHLCGTRSHLEDVVDGALLLQWSRLRKLLL